MKKNKRNNICLYILCICIFLQFFLLLNNVYAAEDSTTYKAKVVELIDIKDQSVEAGKTGEDTVNQNINQYVKVKIISNGKYKGQEYTAEYCIKSEGTIESPKLKLGNKVLVSIEQDQNGELNVIVTDIYRINYLLIVFAIFIAIILLIGKTKGVKTLISLLVTVLSVIYILLPLISKGHSAILSSIIACIFIAIVSLLIIGGINKKSGVAIIGTIFGVIAAGILAICISKLANITGLTNEESQMLIYISNERTIDVKGIFFASIIIGTIGATMDISMSIASTMMELTQNVKNISVKKLIESGLNVGKDSMGTMASTLILAYVGGSLNLLLLLVLNNPNYISVINSDYISSEILRSLCGTIGMLVSIPVTAVVYGMLYGIFERNPLLDKTNFENKKNLD